MPRITRGRTAAEQIADHYASRINAGEYPENSLLPSTRDIAAEWDVSTRTAWLAMHRLKAAKLVTITRAGTFAGPPRAALAAGSVVITGAAILEHPPEYVRAILELEPLRMDGLCPIIRREELLIGLNDRPVILTVEWVPHRYAEACPELAEPDLLPDHAGALDCIEDRTGARAARCRQSREARWPLDDGREMPLLRLDFHDPVLAEVALWFDPAGTPMVYQERTIIGWRVTETELAV